jgi:hypothetical protein
MLVDRRLPTADGRSVSRCRRETKLLLAGILRFVLEDFHSARAGLLRKDLIAHDATRHQLLSLPPAPVLAAPERGPAPPAPPVAPSHIRHALRDFLARLDEPRRR